MNWGVDEGTQPDLIVKNTYQAIRNMGAAVPSPHALVAFMTAPILEINASEFGCNGADKSSVNRCVPIRHGKHFPQDSSAKNSIALCATSSISRVSSNTMMPAAPSIAPTAWKLGSSIVLSRSLRAINPPDILLL